jgi:hypothetical protein
MYAQVWAILSNITLRQNHRNRVLNENKVHLRDKNAEFMRDASQNYAP